MSRLPDNLHIVHAGPRTPAEKNHQSVPMADWLIHPEHWSRTAFVAQISECLDELDGQTHHVDCHLVAMLVSQVEIYVQCWRELQSQGLTSTFNDGRTPGKNLHVAMADRALKQVAMLMGELRLTPKTRPPKKPTGEWADFLKGP